MKADKVLLKKLQKKQYFRMEGNNTIWKFRSSGRKGGYQK